MKFRVPTILTTPKIGGVPHHALERCIPLVVAAPIEVERKRVQTSGHYFCIHSLAIVVSFVIGLLLDDNVCKDFVLELTTVRATLPSMGTAASKALDFVLAAFATFAEGVIISSELSSGTTLVLDRKGRPTLTKRSEATRRSCRLLIHSRWGLRRSCRMLMHSRWGLRRGPEPMLEFLEEFILVRGRGLSRGL